MEGHTYLVNVIKAFLSEELISTDLNFYHIGATEVFSPKYEKHE